MSPLDFNAQIAELTKDITKLKEMKEKGNLSKAEERKLRDLEAAKASISKKLQESLTGNKKEPPTEAEVAPQSKGNGAPYSVEEYQNAFREAASMCPDRNNDPDRLDANCIFDKMPKLLNKKPETEKAEPGFNIYKNECVPNLDPSPSDEGISVGFDAPGKKRIKAE